MKQEGNKGKVLSILKGIVIAFLSIILLLNISIMVQAKLNPDQVPGIFGYKPFIVLSSSMETKIEIGDLVIVKDVDAKEIDVGDIIAFRDTDNLVVTHRIVKVVNTEKGRCFETKGDNNNVSDNNVVCPNNIEGKYRKKIPKIGHVILFIQEPLGFTVMMLSIAIVCIFIYLISNRKVDNELVLSEEEFEEFEEFKKEKAKKEKKKKKEVN